MATSIVGAKFLKALDFQPDLVYLDSAHEQDETYFEIGLYYELLRPGGVLFGDDFLWSSVSHDVRRFTDERGLDLHNLDGNTWAIVKP